VSLSWICLEARNILKTPALAELGTGTLECLAGPAGLHEIDKDPVRKELDERFGREEVLGLAEPMLTSRGTLELLRMKLALEPSIRGNKLGLCRTPRFLVSIARSYLEPVWLC